MRADTVAVVNTNPDLIEAIQDLLESGGLNTCAIHLVDLQEGRADFSEFLEEYDPATLVVDVPPDYEANARFVQRVLAPQLRGRRLILTSTNARRVAELLGETVIPILAKPAGLDHLVEVVLDDAAAGPSE